jgi:hypothetical protein
MPNWRSSRAPPEDSGCSALPSQGRIARASGGRLVSPPPTGDDVVVRLHPEDQSDGLARLGPRFRAIVDGSGFKLLLTLVGLFEHDFRVASKTVSRINERGTATQRKGQARIFI